MSDLRLTILGSGVAWANPGGACSGYLVRSGDTAVMLDCGSGTLGRLRALLDPRQLSGIVISHLHADHFIDLIGLRYGILHGGLGEPGQLRVLLPPGGVSFLAGLGRALDGNEQFFASTFALEEYSEASPSQLGSISIRHRRVQHYIPCYAMRVETGRTLVFSGDAAPCDALVEHARGADALLTEAAIYRREQDEPDPARRGHMTAAEAGEMATRAGVATLFLTHSQLDDEDRDRDERGARTTFAGTVIRVRDGTTYTV